MESPAIIPVAGGVEGRPIARQDALGRVTRVEYDRLGQPLCVTHADGSQTRAAYGPLGNVTR